MAEQMEMDDILGDKPAERPVEQEAPAEAVPDAAAEAVVREAAEEKRKEDYRSKRQQARDKESEAQGKVRDPNTGQFVTAKEPAPEAKPAAPAVAEPAKQAAQPAQEFTDKEKAFLRAAQEERNKRQALERQMAELQAKLPQEPAKTFYDDPDGALAKQKQDFETAITGMRLQTAEGIARSRYKDFDEKVAVFSQLAEVTPGLAQHMIRAADPAEFAYRTAANHMAIMDAGGIDQLRAKIEAETTTRVRAELEKELKDKSEALAKERAALPGSLSDASGRGGQNRVVWSGPESMDSILRNK